MGRRRQNCSLGIPLSDFWGLVSKGKYSKLAPEGVTQCSRGSENMQMEFLGFEMLQSVVIPPPFFSRVSPKGAGSKALLNATDKQRATKETPLPVPKVQTGGVPQQSTQRDTTGICAKRLCSTNPVPFDPALYSDRSEHLCLALLMHIILSGQ